MPGAYHAGPGSFPVQNRGKDDGVKKRMAQKKMGFLNVSGTPPRRPKEDVAGTPPTRPPPLKINPPLVNVAPGIKVPLRRVQETSETVAADFYVPVQWVCGLDQLCIADVRYFICPDCKVVTPLEGDTFEGRPIRRHGLGMGFDVDSLFSIQAGFFRRKNK